MKKRKTALADLVARGRVEDRRGLPGSFFKMEDVRGPSPQDWTFKSPGGSVLPYANPELDYGSDGSMSDYFQRADAADAARKFLKNGGRSNIVADHVSGKRKKKPLAAGK